MTDPFKNYLSSTGALLADEINFSAEFFKPINLKKGDFFIREDEICRHIGFIASGAIKFSTLVEITVGIITVYLAVRSCSPTDDFSNFFKEDLLRIESIYQYFDSEDKLF